MRRREFITLLGGADCAALDWRLNAVPCRALRQAPDQDGLFRTASMPHSGSDRCVDSAESTKRMGG
jgi:hypothetical protein